MVHAGKPTNPKTDGAGRNALGKYLRRTRLPAGASMPQAALVAVFAGMR